MTTITTQHMLSRAHWRRHGHKRTKKEKERKRSIKDNKHLTIEVYSQSSHSEVQVFVSKHTIATARNEGFSNCRKFHPINNKIGESTSIRANHWLKRGGMPQRDNKRPWSFAITHMKQHAQNKADGRTNIVILPGPIHNKGINAFSTRIPKSGIETREFSIQMICKTINRMRTPS